MKRKAFIVVFTLVLCLLASSLLPIRRESAAALRANVPLDEETVAAALEKAGLPGLLAASETYSSAQGTVHFVVQNPAYSDENIDDILFVADLASAEYDGEGMLFAVFYQKLDSADIDWTAWKGQLDCAAILYGGFEDHGELYRAFCEQEMPSPANNHTVYRWDAQLPEGYCLVTYLPYSYKTHDENGFEVWKHSAVFRVSIYESYGLYEKTRARTEDVSIRLRDP